MAEFDGSVVDDQVLPLKIQFLQRLAQLGFEMKKIVSICGHPYTPLKRNRKDMSVCFPGANSRRNVLLLFETNLPRRMTSPLPQAVAGKIEVFRENGVENVDPMETRPRVASAVGKE